MVANGSLLQTSVWSVLSSCVAEATNSFSSCRSSSSLPDVYCMLMQSRCQFCTIEGPLCHGSGLNCGCRKREFFDWWWGLRLGSVGGNGVRVGCPFWLRHTFYHYSWVNTIVLIVLISLLFPYTMTLFHILCRHLSIAFYLSLVCLSNLLRYIILTHINLFWACLYVSHTLFLFHSLSHLMLHACNLYLNRISLCYVLLQLVWNQSR